MPIARLLQNVVEKRTISIGGALVFAVSQFYPPLLRIYGLLLNDFKYIGPLLVVNAAVSAVGLVVHGLGWISGPLPGVLTALCTLPLLIYSLDQEKYRVIKQALSERKKPMTGEDPHR